MIHTDGRPTIANAPVRGYTDNLTYGILVERVDGQFVVRKRRSVFAWLPGEARRDLIRYWLSRGNRVQYMSGPLGQERVRMFIEDGELLSIDDSGVPASMGRVDRGDA